jgi:cytochrome c553
MGDTNIFGKENSFENHGEHMTRILFHLVVPAAISVCLVALALPAGIHAQSDVVKVYKKNCVLCHAADGSGNSSSGKALGAKDLASSEVQKKTDEELTEVIAKGKGKMPAFSAKLKPEDITQLVAYIRAIPKK